MSRFIIIYDYSLPIIIEQLIIEQLLVRGRLHSDKYFFPRVFGNYTPTNLTLVRALLPSPKGSGLNNARPRVSVCLRCNPIKV